MKASVCDLNDVCRRHDEALVAWYSQMPDGMPSGDDLGSLVLAQHYCNFSLWALEDEARRTNVNDSVIADVKRSIDRWNQRRNDLIERIDEKVLAGLPPPDSAVAEQHSETAGQMIDRLSILSLKIWHMSAYASDGNAPALATECSGKLEILKEQRQDLTRCLGRLLDACAAGRRFFKLYRQFKAYNDPRLNPALAQRR
jgi:hypothetical protein